MDDKWSDKIFSVDNSSFDEVALRVFHFQHRHNKTYKAYADLLKIDAEAIKSISQIPFLPIHFFKTQSIKTTEFQPEIVFESSGTSQSATSHHFVKDTSLYRESFLRTFELFYGPVTNWCIIALLPSYLERKNSSLVFMADELIKRTQHSLSGFYLYEHERLYQTLKRLEEEKQKTIFIGVSFALLDFAENYTIPLGNTLIMETGGMKGRREEIVRDKLHQLLKEKFQVDSIHSEYGMTELCSQAYSKKDGIFHTPPWMKIFIRDEEDPLSVNLGVQNSESGIQSSESKGGISGPGVDEGNSGTVCHSPFATGALNIIDLANVYSCSFIATDDGGRLYHDGSFEVLGRIDNSDIRGCSLMMM